MEYHDSKTKVVIICTKYDDFSMNPHNHLTGKGCPKCAGRGLTTAEHIERFREVYGLADDYSEFGPYETAKTKYTFICCVHDRFQQTTLDRRIKRTRRP